MSPRIQSAVEWAARGTAVILSLFVLDSTVTLFAPLQERAIFLLLVLVLTFLANAAKRKSLLWLGADLLCAVASIIDVGYVVLNYSDIELRSGLVHQIDIVLGVIAVVLVLIAAWRTVGKAMTVLAIIFLLYGMYGQALPRAFGGHGGFDVERITTYTFLSMNGIFGDVLYVMFKYVFLFVMFGKLLEYSGAMSFMMDLAKALVGRFRGGPALMGVVASGMMGMVSGSAVANVMVVGSMTIPLMKKLGFRPHMAGGVEAVASTGGQLMPPVMGAAAFLIAQFLGISYAQVMIAAALPAVLYYLCLLGAVYFYSSAMGLRGLPKAELPNVISVLRRGDGVVFIAGVAVLVALLVMQFSPMRAALYAMVAIVVATIVVWRPIGPRKAMAVLESTAMDFTSIGAAAGAVGIIVAMLLLTGLATRFSGLILGFAGQNLILVLILTMLVAIVLGCGVPTTIAYVILVMTAAPSLLKLGVAPLPAHMFIFYGSMMSMVTPPVAMAAYAGATLAGASFWKTGYTATKLAIPLFLLPFAFVIEPSLLLMGPPSKVVVAAVFALIGVTVLAYGVSGASRRNTSGSYASTPTRTGWFGASPTRS